MKQLILVLTGAVGLLAGPSFASVTIGNAGWFLHCSPTNQPETYELLDFYEGRYFDNGFSVDFGPTPPASSAGLFEQARVEFAIRRLEKLDPERTRRLLAVLSSFEPNAAFLSDRDAGGFWIDKDYGIVPPMDVSCHLEVVANQAPVGPTRKTRFLIYEPIWQAIATVPNARAGLILHEVVYSDFLRDNSAQTSESARAFTRLLASGALANMSPDQYQEFLRANRIDVEVYWDLLFHATACVVGHAPLTRAEAAEDCRLQAEKIGSNWQVTTHLGTGNSDTNGTFPWCVKVSQIKLEVAKSFRMLNNQAGYRLNEDGLWVQADDSLFDEPMPYSCFLRTSTPGSP